MSLYVSAPLRGCARGRSADRLALCLAMIGSSILSPGKQIQALEHLAALYYKTPGSATTAMRTVVNELNSLLLKRNQHLAGSGKQGTGLLAQLVWRGSSLYMALSGPLHLFLISANEIQHVFDADMAGKSVGLLRYPPLWFHQMNINSEDRLILAAPPVPAWDDRTLDQLRGQEREVWMKALMPAPEVDINAVLFQARPGKGAFILETVSKVDETTEVESLPDEVASPVVEIPFEEMTAAPETQPLGQEKRVEPVSNEQYVAPLPVVTNIQAFENVSKPGITPEVAEIRTQPASSPEKKTETLLTKASKTSTLILKILMSATRSLVDGIRRLGAGVRKVFSRFMPDEFFKGIPSSVMIFIAIAIPVIIVVVASQIYFSLGHEAKNQALLEQANRQAAEAEKQTDLLAKKAGWENVLNTLKSIDDNPQVQALRVQGITALDSLQLVTRLDYSRALAKNLPAEIKVTQMAVQGSDLYLLDGNSGNVIRTYETSAGYVVDTGFLCGPTVQGVSISGPLIDIAAWPAGFRPIADVLAIDGNWNSLLCLKNDAPARIKLAQPTNAVIGNLIGFTLDMDDLFVLDPTSNAVWIYWNNQMLTAPEDEPYPFFKDEIPVLDDVIDMVMSIDELHLLHADGRLTVCTYSGIKEIPTRCNDPAFIDFRPGFENTPLVPSPRFTQVVYTPPPEPSLYFLEPESNAIYKFSVRSLGFQKQYLSAAEIAVGEATAFTIDNIRRIIYLAVGSQVFKALMP